MWTNAPALAWPADGGASASSSTMRPSASLFLAVTTVSAVATITTSRYENRWSSWTCAGITSRPTTAPPWLSSNGRASRPSPAAAVSASIAVRVEAAARPPGAPLPWGRPGRSSGRSPPANLPPRSAVPLSARDGRRCAVVLLAEEALCVEGGGAAGARRGDGLAVDVILHVAGGEDARARWSRSSCPLVTR